MKILIFISLFLSTSISISTICYISISVQGQILPIYPSLLFSLLLAILWLPATSRSRYVVDSSHSRYINSHTKHFLLAVFFIFNTTFFLAHLYAPTNPQKFRNFTKCKISRKTCKTLSIIARIVTDIYECLLNKSYKSVL